jgi:hypothetical protein
MVDDRVWGAAIVGSTRPEPMPPDSEERVADFTDLVRQLAHRLLQTGQFRPRSSTTATFSQEHRRI